MPEPGEGILPSDPPATGPDEQAEIIRRHRERWVIIGPCLDGGWYAWPRGDETAPRVQAASLPELSTKLK